MRRQYTAHISAYKYHAQQAKRLVLTHGVLPKPNSSIAAAVEQWLVAPSNRDAGETLQSMYS
jgi:hypothetical protein